MHFGINSTWALGSSPAGDDFLRLAQRAENLGFNSFLVGDHVVIPTTFDASNYPYADLGFDDAAPWPDPFMLLAAVAGATKSIFLGTGVAVVPYRPPIQQAQAIATLDFMSRGRFRFGIGIGWMEEEFEALNIPFKERASRTREYITVMKLLWAGDDAAYSGKHLNFPGGRVRPLPVQRPHPPIIVGGEGAPAYRRIVECGDGFQSIFRLPGQFKELLGELGPLMKDAGRSLSELNMQLCTSDIEFVIENKRSIPELEELGVQEIIFTPKSRSTSEGFDWIEKLAKEFRH